MKKSAFDPITVLSFLSGIVGAHVAGNAGLKLALKSKAGKKLLARFVAANANLASKGKAVHPAIRGAMDVIVGPEISAIGSVGERIGSAARRYLPQISQEGIAPITTGRLERFLERTSVPKDSSLSSVKYLAGYGAALPTTMIPGVGHLTAWNALKTALVENPVAHRLGLGRRVAVSTINGGLKDPEWLAKVKSPLYTYGASPIQGWLYDTARTARRYTDEFISSIPPGAIEKTTPGVRLSKV